MKNLKDYSDQELNKELSRRWRNKYARRRKILQEEQRIYNLPENVEKRKREQEEYEFQLIAKKMKGYNLKEKGVWSIYGEDPNCDMGGSHHEPYLGKVEGTLENAIKYAVKLHGFFTWGGGGKIIKDEPEKITKV